MKFCCRQVQQQSGGDNEGKPQTIVSQSLHVDNYRLLAADFYACDALDLAPRLLGKLLRHGDVILQITEVGVVQRVDAKPYNPTTLMCRSKLALVHLLLVCWM